MPLLVPNLHDTRSQMLGQCEFAALNSMGP